jgi:carboxypeptidase Taq
MATACTTAVDIVGYNEGRNAKRDMRENYNRLKARLDDINNLNRANAVLSWDLHTQMPPGGSAGRGAQMATLSRLSHELFTADETGELLQAAAEEVKDLSFDSDEASLVRVALRDYEDDRKIPPSLVSQLTEQAVRSHEVWVRARENNDFASFAPCLERTIELMRELAEHLGYEDRMYDALLDRFEPGMKARQVQEIFDGLKGELIPLVRAIGERADAVDDRVLHQPFDEARQESFARMVVERFGYDFSRGRLDRTVHPFATSFGRGDVRITTRYSPTFLNMALFGTMHESGHGMYEQGMAESLSGTLLEAAASLGVHESQSRLWENVVGRSRAFWQHFYPQLQEAFPNELGSASLDTFYRAINKVQPSFIRVEADEVTYNLHIMLRFEMEMDLLDGTYPVQEAPEVWNGKMEEYLGIRPPTNTLGILQDVHWTGQIGYFPTYSLGTILSLQLYDRAVQERPDIPEQIGRGDFSGLHGWLTEKVYQYGRKFEPNDLIERATGEPLQTGPYMNYLKTKFGDIYGL